MRLNLGSSPRPDDLNRIFYRVVWHIIKIDVCESIREFFEEGRLPQGYTSTHLSLIPKKANSDNFSDLRPISVCNFNYTVIAKIIVERLNHILPHIISEEQIGFIKEKSIQENIVLAQEMTADIDKKIRGGNTIIKIDMSKTCDRVEWEFFMLVLKKFGFGEFWCELVTK